MSLVRSRSKKESRGKTRAQIIAQQCFSPIVGQCGGRWYFRESKFRCQRSSDAVPCSANAADKAKSGNRSEQESMLAAQAIALNIVLAETKNPRSAAIVKQTNIAHTIGSD
jgi:hypothetical protein